MSAVLLTGGAGYIGSHTCVALAQAGFEPVLLDNFSNSSPQVLPRLQSLIGQAVVCQHGDVADVDRVRAVLEQHQIRAVIHFAGFKAVGESVAQPLKYYDNNVVGTLRLMQAMQATACRALVFSSSATVYGNPHTVPITEDFPYRPESPYGHSKMVCEAMLAAQCRADASWRTGVLRYFNPVGAHPSGQIGESPRGVPNNLMPYLTQVALGQRSHLQIFGNDYPTPDGTGVRDYIHVQDLARGHVAAVQRLLGGAPSLTVNLGTGVGYSVLDVVKAFERATGQTVPFQIAPRRDGDVPAYWADPHLARSLLGWTAQHSLEDMCAHAWNWQCRNPQGYE